MKLELRTALAAIVLMTAFVFAGCMGEGDVSGSGENGGEGSGEEETTNSTTNDTGGPIMKESVSWTVGGSGCTTSGGLYFFAGALEGVDHAPLSLDSKAGGYSFEANITADAPSAQWGASFWSGDELVDYDSSAEDSLTGKVPDQADRVIFWSCGGGMVQVDFVVTAGD